MTKKIIFKGAGTALITPMKNGKIDYDALRTLIHLQIDEGIDALIMGGTTGESATLKPSEREQLYSFSKEEIGGRVKLLLGVGSNDTSDVLARCRAANRVGCDGVLAVTPYYNRGTRDGVIEHYRRVADASDAPVMLYNVPSRTGVNLSIDVLETLAREENIVAIKEAGDSLDRLCDIAALGDSLALYAGNDSQIFPTLTLGGLGVVSVLSNLMPRRVSVLCRECLEGDIERARGEQLSLLGIIKALFTETNPAPIKYAMSRLGLCENELRLPLSPASEKTRAAIDEALSIL